VFECLFALAVERYGVRGLLPRLELHRECAASRGLLGSPGIRWSAVMSLRSVNGCLQMWQCVAVARRCALTRLYLASLYRVLPALRPACLIRSRSSCVC
jgi:hypothetical protein